MVCVLRVQFVGGHGWVRGVCVVVCVLVHVREFVCM